MILTTAPSALPGSCYLCGSASREAFVDLNTSIEFHGAFYLCNICVNEMAHLLGFTNPEKTSELLARIEELESEKFELSRQNAGYERALDGLRFAGIDVALPVQQPVAVPVDHAPPAAEPSQGEDQLGSGEGTSPEPTDDPLLAGVHTGELSHGGSEFTLDL